MTAKETLQTAAALVSGDRQQTHGDAETNYAYAAALFSEYRLLKTSRFSSDGVTDTLVACTFDAEDMLWALVFCKFGRYMSHPENTDNLIDACGYLALINETRTAKK